MEVLRKPPQALCKTVALNCIIKNMKKIFFALVLTLIATHSFGQDSNSNLEINYDLLKTTYLRNGVEVSQKEFKAILIQDKIAYKQFERGRTMMTTGSIIGTPGIILLLVTIQNSSNGNTPYAAQWIGGIGGSLAGTVLYYAGRKSTLEGVSVFNNNQKISLELDTKNGVGLLLKF
jgi:hypothetical protein